MEPHKNVQKMWVGFKHFLCHIANYRKQHISPCRMREFTMMTWYLLWWQDYRNYCKNTKPQSILLWLCMNHKNMRKIMYRTHSHSYYHNCIICRRWFMQCSLNILLHHVKQTTTMETEEPTDYKTIIDAEEDVVPKVKLIGEVSKRRCIHWSRTLLLGACNMWPIRYWLKNPCRFPLE